MTLHAREAGTRALRFSSAPTAHAKKQLSRTDSPRSLKLFGSLERTVAILARTVSREARAAIDASEWG